MRYEAEMSISTEVLESYREEKLIEEQRLLELSRSSNLKEGIGIHTRQLERLNAATNEELFRWFIMDSSEKYL